jgi:hypothetical protein
MYLSPVKAMRQIHRTLVAIALVISTSDAVGETLKTEGEDLVRAAYCAGVLQEMYRVHSENLDVLRSAFAKNFCDHWQQEGFDSGDSCAEQKSQNALVGTRVKMERYTEYMRLRTIKSGEVETAQMGVLRAKGRNDQMYSWTRRDSRDFACSTSCRIAASKDSDAGSPKCVADCIERYDPAQASVYRCVVLHNGLPF